ncbi:MAG: pirin family protein [Bacteroidales bacterium]|nr:pirin family protein [Bacteroidales bacterium]
MYDPFIFCAHHKDQYPRGTKEFGPGPDLLSGRNIGNDFTVKNGFRMYHGNVVPGFPVHPHRGFETVTITLEGLIDHADSLGGAGRYGQGDVQWMTAGKGIQHAEMFPLIYREKENPLELLQIWINLPKKNKFVDPYYKMLWHEDLPVIREKDKNGRNIITRVIAGTFRQTRALDPTPDSWAADPGNEVGIWIIEMEPDSELKLPSANEQITRTVYNYRGDGLIIDGQEIPGYHQALLNASSELNIRNKEAKSTFLIAQGKPIAEPVAQYGPFVMNTRTEIQQAYQDYTTTRFGGWPWDRNDPVHGSEPVRFAKFADGEKEER